MSENEMPHWDELADLFGGDNIGIVDRAIGEYLADQPLDTIRRDEFYLVSEGLTYAVLLAMRERSVRFAPELRCWRKPQT